VQRKELGDELDAVTTKELILQQSKKGREKFKKGCGGINACRRRPVHGRIVSGEEAQHPGDHEGGSLGYPPAGYRGKRDERRG